MLDEITRLSALVDNLITLSRMDSLWGKASHNRLDLRDLTTETIEQMHLLLEDKGISILSPKGSAVHVSGDRDRIKQVIVNLIDNAIKYTEPGGHININVEANTDVGILSIEDSGIGIEPEHRLKVFERFYRISPNRGASGAGLGLAIVKSICQAHGGQVWVQSASGGPGSSFVVELPLASATSTHRFVPPVL
jgi:signal transduction histidine kinase